MTSHAHALLPIVTQALEPVLSPLHHEKTHDH
jgi:hypothetical protein